MNSTISPNREFLLIDHVGEDAGGFVLPRLEDGDWREKTRGGSDGALRSRQPICQSRISSAAQATRHGVQHESQRQLLG